MALRTASGACQKRRRKVNFGAAQSLTVTVLLPLQTYLYSATAAAVVQSPLYMNFVQCVILHHFMWLQCFDGVGWAAERASGL